METRPGIEVDENGLWLYQKRPIRNEGVLRYFKSNLHRAPGGFYILNRFGELKEEAYLDAVRGFPLHALRAEIHSGGHPPRPVYLQISLDSGEDIRIDPAELCVYGETILGFVWKERDIPVRLSRGAMSDLMDYLEETAKDEVRLIFEERSIVLTRADRETLFSL